MSSSSGAPNTSSSTGAPNTSSSIGSPRNWLNVTGIAVDYRDYVPTVFRGVGDPTVIRKSGVVEALRYAWCIGKKVLFGAVLLPNHSGIPKYTFDIVGNLLVDYIHNVHHFVIDKTLIMRAVLLKMVCGDYVIMIQSAIDQKTYTIKIK